MDGVEIYEDSEKGKVMDTYIPINKRSKTGSRFRFVRYQTLKEADNAIKRWNGLDVGGKKLVVILEGQTKDNNKPEEREEWFQKSQPHKIWRAKILQEENLQKESEDASDASKDRNPDGKKKIELQAIAENTSWLRRCAVGRTKNLETIWELEEKMISLNIIPTSIYSMGAMKVMVRFPNELEMKQTLKENKKKLQDLFVEIDPWREGYVIQSRTIWINITEIPFQAWETTNFEKIANLFGKFIAADPESMNGSCLENSRVLIETENFQMIREEVEAELENKTFKVFIWEECLQVSPAGSQENSPTVSNMPESGEDSGKGSGEMPEREKQGCTESQIRDSKEEENSKLICRTKITMPQGRKEIVMPKKSPKRKETEMAGEEKSWVSILKLDNESGEGKSRKNQILHKEICVYQRRGKHSSRTAEASWMCKALKKEQERKDKALREEVVGQPTVSVKAKEIREKQKSGKKTEVWDDGEEETDEDTFNEEAVKSQKSMKKEKRKESKKKEIIKHKRSQMKSKLNQSKRSSEEKQKRVQKTDLITEEDKLKEVANKEKKRRKEGELTYQFGKRMGIEYLESEEEAIQLIMNTEEDR